MESVETIKKYNFDLNNDEIDKVSDTIHRLRDSLAMCKTEKEIDKVQDDILTLLAIKAILYSANVVYNPKEFVVIDEMRIKKSDYDKFFDLLSKVSIDGLDVVKPLREGDFLPGTKNMIKVPRDIKDNESIDEYEDYLYNFYQNNGYNLAPREYVEGTNVYKVREPYLHEKYKLKLTDDGYEIDKNFGSRHPYYRRMKRYYEMAASKALDDVKKKNNSTTLDSSQENEKKIYAGAYISKAKKHPLKVDKTEQLPLDLTFFSSSVSRKSILDVLIEKGRSLFPVDQDESYVLTKEEKRKIKDKNNYGGIRLNKKTFGELLETWNLAAEKNISDNKNKVIKMKPVATNLLSSAKKQLKSFSDEELFFDVSSDLNDESKIKITIPEKVISIIESIEAAEKAREELLINLKIIGESTSESEKISLKELETLNYVRYYDLVERGFKALTEIYEDIIAVSDGTSIINGMPDDLLITFGMNASIVSGEIEPNPDVIDSVVKINDTASAKYPKFADKISFLSKYLKGKKAAVNTQKIETENNGLMDSFVAFEEYEGSPKL